MATKFEAAFASARKGGKKEFSFGGKKYNTKLKGEGGKAKSKLPKKGPVPEKRPMSKPASGKTTSSKPTEAKASAAVMAKKPTSEMKKAIRIQTGPQTKSYAERNKKPPVRMGSGGGY